MFHFYLFADDTNIYYEANTLDDLQSIELKELQIWLIVNRLSLNIDKTNFVIHHPYNKPVKQKITLKLHKNATQRWPKSPWSGVALADLSILMLFTAAKCFGAIFLIFLYS